jgi:hypothetical protein
MTRMSGRAPAGAAIREEWPLHLRWICSCLPAAAMNSASSAKTWRGAPLLLPLLLCTGLLLPRAARAEEPLRPVATTCTGWAVPGALVGAFSGSLLAMGSMKAAGEDLNAPQNQTRNGWILGSSVLVGMSAGPILTCKLFDKEPYAIPKATFVLAGMSVGGIGAGAAWFALHAESEKGRGGSAADRAARGEGASVIGALLGIVGAFAGATGGYFLHEALFHQSPSRTVSAKIEPLTAPGSAGVVVSGSF